MDQGLRICMFSNLLPPAYTGSSTFTWSLARRLGAKGHAVTVVTAQMADEPASEMKGGVTIHRLRAIRLPQMRIAHNFKWLTWTFTPANLRRLDRLFQRHRFDVVHQQNHIFDTILSSPRMARRYGLPLVLTIHTFAQHTNRFYNWILGAFDALARKVIIEKADVVVSPDTVVQEYVGVRHRVISSPVIPYGVEVSTPRSEDVGELRRRFRLGNGPVILSLGHLHRLRDRMDLIRAMPAVLSRFPAAQLLIVGEVQIQDPVTLANTLGLQQRVAFTGALPRAQVPALFALAALEAHTFAGDYPGPGIASMEAMAAGLPVVTGAIDSRYDFGHFRNWENVVMVPRNRPKAMGSAITRLLANQSLRERIGANARRMMAERYSWDSVCNAYVALYRRTIEQRASAWRSARRLPSANLPGPDGVGSGRMGGPPHQPTSSTQTLPCACCLQHMYHTEEPVCRWALQEDPRPAVPAGVSPRQPLHIHTGGLGGGFVRFCAPCHDSERIEAGFIAP